MRRTLLSTLFALSLAPAAGAQDATCTFPWTPDYDQGALFEVGRFYRSPYNEVIEVLGRTCRHWDADVCSYELSAVRNVQGRAIKTAVVKSIVWATPTGLLYYADGEIPLTTPIGVGKWAPLPEGCYTRSAVVAVEGTTLTVRRGTE